MNGHNRYKRKVVALPRLLDLLDSSRSDGSTVVQCHGCFDIVHPGHIRYLEFASRQGDILVVTLTGDSEINKGDQSPYIPEELRAESLAALEFVDFVCIDAAPTAAKILQAIRPDVYVKGREYETYYDPRFQTERTIVEEHGGRVIFSSGDVVFSSTALAASMPGEQELKDERLELVCRRHDISQTSLTEILDKFQSLRVGVVGDIIIDRYVFCDAVDVASESPMLSLAQLEEKRYVGGAAIVARHAAALGAQTFLVSNGADDERGKIAREVLSEEGVEFCSVAPRESLVEKTRYLVEENKVFKS